MSSICKRFLIALLLVGQITEVLLGHETLQGVPGKRPVKLSSCYCCLLQKFAFASEPYIIVLCVGRFREERADEVSSRLKDKSCMYEVQLKSFWSFDQRVHFRELSDICFLTNDTSLL